jgi:adenosylmethionine-8-amino-7-oxononanoate aminotransferase
LGEVVPLVPPLTITSEELERIVSVLEQAISTVGGGGARG